VKNDDVEQLLDEVPEARTRNIVEDNQPLADAISYFLRLKAEGDKRAHVSLKWFYENKLRQKYGGPKSIDTVRKYARDVLGLDPKTGESIR
jgi:hypothetical protein